MIIKPKENQKVVISLKDSFCETFAEAIYKNKKFYAKFLDVLTDEVIEKEISKVNYWYSFDYFIPNQEVTFSDSNNNVFKGYVKYYNNKNYFIGGLVTENGYLDTSVKPEGIFLDVTYINKEFTKLYRLLYKLSCHLHINLLRFPKLLLR